MQCLCETSSNCEMNIFLTPILLEGMESKREVK